MSLMKIIVRVLFPQILIIVRMMKILRIGMNRFMTLKKMLIIMLTKSEQMIW